jgi:hypothetical protein
MALQLGEGAIQGAIADPIEGIGQLVERTTGMRLAPQFIRDTLKSFRTGVEKSDYGEYGRWAGIIGSTVAPFGGPLLALARGAKLAQAAEAARAGEAGLTAVRSAMMKPRAGPLGYAAVRDAVLPGEKARRGMSAALKAKDAGRPLGGAVQDWETGGVMDRLGAVPESGGPRAGAAPKVRPSKAKAATEDVLPPDPPVGAPTAGERIRLAAKDLVTAAPGAARRFGRRHPVVAGALQGAATGAAQPVESGDYWDTKKAQAAGGAVTAGFLASPAGRRLANLAAHYGMIMVPAGGAIHTAAHALGPLTYGMVYPLHHLARHAAYRATRHSQPTVDRVLAHMGRQRAAGAMTGAAIGGEPSEDEQ